jgi:hypothetical protein
MKRETLCKGAGRSGPRIPVRARDTFFFTKSPDRLWGSPILLFSAYRGSFLGAKRPVREVKLHLALRLRMSGAIPLLPLIPPWRGQGKLHLLLFTFYQYYYFYYLIPDGVNGISH